MRALLLITLLLGAVRWLVPSTAIDLVFIAVSVAFVVVFVIGRMRQREHKL